MRIHFFVPKGELDTSGLSYIHVLINGTMRVLLIDNGATVSILKDYCLLDEEIDSTNVMTIVGVCGSLKSMGRANVKFNIEDNQVDHIFTILKHFETRVDGILGVDFLIQRSACIDYSQRIFTFFLNRNLEIKINLGGRAENCLTVPSQCQMICYCEVKETEECVVMNELLTEGVIVASTICKPENGKIPVRILNTRGEPVVLKNFCPSTRKLEEFNIHSSFEKTRMTSEKAREIIDLIKLNHLKGIEHDSLYRICLKYFDVFHNPSDKLGVTNLYKEKIVLHPNAQPVFRKQYRMAQSQKKIIDSEINKMIENDIIEPAKSPWSSPLLLVPKHSADGEEKKWRVVIDFRELNEKIVADRFPLTNMTDIIDSLGGAAYFTHLDMSSGYYQVELEENSRPCTAFVTDKGQYQLKRLPMGLKISPSAFSRLMTIAVSGLTTEECFTYMDDLIVYGRNLEEHNKNLALVLERLREVNLKLNPSKCEFLKKSLLYLGHQIGVDGVRPDPEKVKAVKEWPVPKGVDEAKRFVAFMNYYRRFIKNFAELAVPLNRLTRKGVKFVWDEQCEKSFQTLKLHLTTPPLLQYPDFSENNVFILRTDASKQAIGAVLSNSDDMPVSYASRPLNKAELNYPIIELELLAIVWAVQYFRPYLFGRKFTILTDHRPLVYLFGMTDPSSRLTKF